MKERKYKNDWINERRLDPKTGREKTVPVYKGTYYRTEKPEDVRKQAVVSGVLTLLLLALLFIYFRLDYPGTRTMYVFLPASLSLFPCLYGLMGCFSSFFGPAKMTRTDRETGAGRVLRSAAGCAIFLGIACLGDLLFLLFFQAPEPERIGILFLIASFLVALFLAFYAHRVYLGIKEV